MCAVQNKLRYVTLHGRSASEKHFNFAVVLFILAIATHFEQPLQTGHVSISQSEGQTKCGRNEIVDEETGIKSKPKLKEEEEHDKIQSVERRNTFANEDFTNSKHIREPNYKFKFGMGLSFVSKQQAKWK